MLAKFSSTGRTCVVALALVFAAVLSPAAASAETARRSTPGLDVSFEATPQPGVNAMLTMARVGPDDFVIDLGSGDGRIPITAAKDYGARGQGVDLDPRRIEEARANAEQNGVLDKVGFVEGNLFDADISKATVITLFLWPDMNLKLRPRLLALAPGTRIVSHDHDMGDWRPDITRTRKRNAHSDLYLWVVPAKVNGTWQLSDDGRVIDVRIEQKYQRFSGSAVVDGRSRPIRNGRINGAEVSFDLTVASGKSRRYTGRVTPIGAIDGDAWQAKRKE
jgi:hypothetical protein